MKKNNSWILKGGRIIDPANHIDRTGDLWIKDGIIVEPGSFDPSLDETETINLKGLVVAPGLIDMHVHLRQPGNTDAETIRTGTMAAAAGGFTPLTTSIYREVSDPKGIGVALSLSNGMVYLLIFASGQLAGFMLDIFGGDAIRKVGDVVIYPPRAYLAVLAMLLVMVSFAIWNGSRVPETNGRNIYKG